MTDSEQWKREAAAAFDQGAAGYTADRESSPWYRTQLDFTFQALPRGDARVLDLGCATGVEIAALRTRGFDVTGADFTHAMLVEARERFLGDRRVRLARADAEFLPFPDGAFDHVVCLGVLEYLKTYGRALDEIGRVLRPGGTAVIAVPSRISLYNLSEAAGHAVAGPVLRAVRRLSGRRTRGVTPPHRRNLCIPGQLLAQLKSHGFEPLDWAHTACMFAPFERFWPAAQERFAKRMEPFMRSRALGWMGSQFMVAARRRAPAP